MVSLRRRRLLGLCSGKNSIPVQLPGVIENGYTVENPNKNVKSFSVHPMPSFISSHQKEINISEASLASSNVSASSSSKEDAGPYFAGILLGCMEFHNHSHPMGIAGKQIKHRKRHRRKHHEDHEPCMMRGVYFKNMKWQAAIKVDKKQIHLGTVGSQEEAGRLYDRAAFMCGREPNFELSEEEKQELKQYEWEDFLVLTRNAITNKKHQRRIGNGGRRKKAGTELQSGDWRPQKGMDGSSGSEDGDAETSAS